MGGRRHDELLARLGLDDFAVDRHLHPHPALPPAVRVVTAEGGLQVIRRQQPRRLLHNPVAVHLRERSKVVRTGFGEVAPRPHRLAFTIAPHWTRSSRSPRGPPLDDEVELVPQVDVAHAAGHADPARLVDEELQVVADDGQQVAVRVEDGHRPVAREVLVGDLAIGLGGDVDTLPRRAADLDGRGVPRSDALENLAERDPPLDLVDARPAAVAGHRSNRVPDDSEVPRLEPVVALLHDAGEGRERFHVVDTRRQAVVALLRRERRLDARGPSAALARLDEGRLLTAHVGAGADLDPDVEVEAATPRDVLAEQPVLAHLLQLGLQVVLEVPVLRPKVDDTVRPADGEGADDHPDEDLLGRAGEQYPVLEGAWLTLVGVADDVPALADRRAAQLPLQPGEEPRASPAT